MVKQDLILSMSEPTNRTIYAKKGDSGRLYDIFIADAEKENGTLRILQPDGSEVTAPAIIQAGGDAYKGDLVTFDALEEVPLTKCEVALESTQDGTPWIGSDSNEVPYNFRAVSDSGLTIGNVEYDEIHGGTIAFNQYADMVSTTGTHKAEDWASTLTHNADGSITVTTTRDYVEMGFNFLLGSLINKGHKYLVKIILKSISFTPQFVNMNMTDGWSPTQATSYKENYTSLGEYATMFAPTSSGTLGTAQRLLVRLGFTAASGQTVLTGSTFTISGVTVVDLTQMFGSTIADYIYSLETGTAGAGVAWFRNLFPKPYYAYNSGTLLSVTGLSKHKTVGFNLFDKSAIEAGKWFNDSNGTITNATGYNLSDYIRVTPNSTLYHSATGSLRGLGFDASKNIVNAGTWTFNFTNSGTYTVPSNVHYIRFVLTDANVSSMIVNLSSSKNGTYEPYTAHEYALDSDVVLRGIPKLDASNKLYYDGDVYGASGSVTRKYGIITLVINSTNFYYNTTINALLSKSAYALTSAKAPSSNNDIINAICDSVGVNSATSINGGSDGIGINTTKSIYLRVTGLSSLEDYEAKFPSGIDLVYELETPTTDTADAFTSPQSVSADGTEEYVIAEQSGVAMPVGHKSHYGMVYPIVESNGKNLFDPSLFDTYTDNIIYTPFDVPNGTYTMSTEDFPIVYGTANVFFLNGTASTGATSANDGVYKGRPITFTVTSGKYTVAYRSYFSSNTNDPKNFKWQIEKGSTATPYVPYQGISLYQVGKNFCPLPRSANAIKYNGSGLTTTDLDNGISVKGQNSGSSHAVGFLLFLADDYLGEKLTLSVTMSGSNSSPQATLFLCDSAFGNRSVLGYLAQSGSVTATVPSTASGKFIGLGLASTTGADSESAVSTYTDIQLEKGETATTYEPYNGTTYPLSLGRKVYGGKVDLVSGKLTVTHAIVDMGDLGWVTGGTNATGIKRMVSNATEVVNYIKKPTSASEVADITCSAYQTLNSNQVYVRMTGVSINTGGSVSLYDENFNTEDSVADFTVSVTGQKLVFALATPIEYDLTAEQINTLLGTNNIWSSGTVEVAFEYDGLFAQLPEEATEQVGKCIGDVAFTGASSMPFILHILDDVQEETP